MGQWTNETSHAAIIQIIFLVCWQEVTWSETAGKPDRMMTYSSNSQINFLCGQADEDSDSVFVPTIPN